MLKRLSIASTYVLFTRECQNESQKHNEVIVQFSGLLQSFSCIFSITTGAINRFFRPWMKADWIFYRTTLGRSFKAAVDTAQNLCTRVSYTICTLISRYCASQMKCTLQTI